MNGPDVASLDDKKEDTKMDDDEERKDDKDQEDKNVKPELSDGGTLKNCALRWYPVSPQL